VVVIYRQQPRSRVVRTFCGKHCVDVDLKMSVDFLQLWIVFSHQRSHKPSQIKCFFSLKQWTNCWDYTLYDKSKIIRYDVTWSSMSTETLKYLFFRTNLEFCYDSDHHLGCLQSGQATKRTPVLSVSHYMLDLTLNPSLCSSDIKELTLHAKQWKMPENVLICPLHFIVAYVGLHSVGPFASRTIW